MKSNLYLLTTIGVLTASPNIMAHSKNPNILFVVADDQSYPYASVYGSKMVRTPGFDFIANNGILFRNAFVTSPGSSPSRASILTGRYTWAIEEAGTHASSFPSKYVCFPDMLQSAGYKIGATGKAWGPGDFTISGRTYNPAGPEFNKRVLTPPYKGISNVDYIGNFNAFLSEKGVDQPFYFWFGANEPHRPFENGSWEKADRNLSEAETPLFLPNSDIVKGDVLDYAIEIEWYDSHLMKMIQLLKEKGELENTIIVVTSDNGMAFPHSKANCYDAGIHVPLAIYWGAKIPKGKVTDELFSTVNLAPTLLDACDVKHQGKFQFQGKSYLNEFVSTKKFIGDKAIFAARERHAQARFNNQGYPMRVIRTNNYLYIQNFHPERWPAGDPQKLDKNGNLEEMNRAFNDIDESPSKKYIIDNREDKALKVYFEIATSKRPEAELYDLVKDPSCMVNLIENQNYKAIAIDLKKRLFAKMKATQDSRLGANPEIWERYPRLKGPNSIFPNNP